MATNLKSYQLRPEQSLELLANFGFDFALKHHRGERQVAIEDDSVVLDGQVTIESHSHGLETKVQSISIPTLGHVLHLIAVATLKKLGFLFQATLGLVSRQGVWDFQT